MQAVGMSKATNVKELKRFCTEEWAKILKKNLLMF